MRKRISLSMVDSPPPWRGWARTVPLRVVWSSAVPLSAGAGAVLEVEHGDAAALVVAVVLEVDGVLGAGVADEADVVDVEAEVLRGAGGGVAAEVAVVAAAGEREVGDAGLEHDVHGLLDEPGVVAVAGEHAEREGGGDSWRVHGDLFRGG
jgi:hypothetical protein